MPKCYTQQQGSQSSKWNARIDSTLCHLTQVSLYTYITVIQHILLVIDESSTLSDLSCKVCNMAGKQKHIPRLYSYGKSHEK